MSEYEFAAEGKGVCHGSSARTFCEVKDVTAEYEIDSVDAITFPVRGFQRGAELLGSGESRVIPCPIPSALRHGELLQSDAGQLVSGDWPASRFLFLSGSMPCRPSGVQPAG